MNAPHTEPTQPNSFPPQWLQLVLDDVEAGLLVEANEEIVYINRAYAALLGYDDPELLRRRNVALIVAECDMDRLKRFGRMRARSEPTPPHYEFTARRRDGSMIRLNAAVSSSVIEGRVIITTLVHAVGPQQPSDPREVFEGGALRSLLTARETQVMELILAGKRIKEIAFLLQISAKTVTTHRQRMLDKLQLTDNRDLFRFALRQQMLKWS